MNLDHVRGLMRERRLTVERTAELLGLSANGLRKKLQGKREFKISQAQRLADILRVPLAEILDNC